MGSSPTRTHAEPLIAGYRDFSYGASLSTPTGEKPESKLWWNDGYWWSAMWDTTASQYKIHRLDVATQSWVNTGVGADNRSNSRADALWDGEHLYLASHVFTTNSEPAPPSTSARLYRYSYNSITDLYTLDAGFPVQINSSKSETLVLDKDSTGKLWITWMEGQKVKINRTTAGDLSWGTPFDLAVQGSLATADDISSVVALGGNKIGLMWSNQNDRKMYFATHLDGQPDQTWEAREEAIGDTSIKIADDHIALRAACDGNGDLYAVTKADSNGTAQSMVLLLKRTAAGAWSHHQVWVTGENHTRPILALDPNASMAHVMAMSDRGGKNKIYLKSASLTDLAFPPGRGTPIIDSDTDSLVNNVTGSKQCVNATTGLVVLASDQVTHYYMHAAINLGATGPTITSFSPASGPVGTLVDIQGTGFATAFDVAFNGTSAASFTVEGDTLLHVAVPAGASTGKLSVTNPDGTGLSAADFLVLVAPTISSFAPASGSPGTLVTIHGSGFAGATGVTFNGVAATSFMAVSDTVLTANVPSGATTGKIAVTNDLGTGESELDFTVTEPGTTLVFYPIGDTQVSSINPNQNYGLLPTMRVRGVGDMWSSFVKFNVAGIGAPVVSASLRLYVTDPSHDAGTVHGVSNHYPGTATPWTEVGLNWNNAPTIGGSALDTLGNVVVGSWTSSDVTAAIAGDSTYSFGLTSGSANTAFFSTREGVARPALIVHLAAPAAPSIASFTPASGPYGTLVEVRGSGLASATGVAFNGIAATGFIFEGDTLLRVAVPVGASTGPLTVENPAGTGASAGDFVVEILPPVLSAFSPGGGLEGTEVQINGSGFATATEVAFNGTVTGPFIVQGDTVVRVTVPAGATTGKISVTNPAGSGLSPTDFVVTAPPTIVSFSPSSGPYGTVVDVHGTAFATATAVAFDGTAAPGFTIVSDTLLQVAVPAGATTGPVTVTNPAGVGASGSDFVVEPTVTAFVPASAPAGALVELHGTGFATATAVAFNDTAASGFTVVSDTLLQVTVPAGATTGKVAVTNPVGTGFSLADFVVILPPTVVWFTPASGPEGTMAEIHGSGFSTATEVGFNGTTATTFTVDSDTLLRAWVPAGASSGKVSVTNPAGTGVSADDFIVPTVGVPLPIGPGIPKVFALAQNRPNPVGARTQIHFQLPSAAHVNLTIFDVQGRSVVELVNADLEAGFFQVPWDGRDRDGAAVSNGTYLFMLNAGTFRQARKMVVIR